MNLRVLPRSFWVLLPLLAAAVVLLLRGGGVPRGPVPLLDVTAADAESLSVRGPSGTVLLSRTGDGWALGGDVADAVDDGAVSDLLRSLAEAQRAPLVGTDAGAAEYGLVGPDVSRLLVVTPQGRRAIVFGAANPVTGNRYARLAGSDGVFQVRGGVTGLLAALPNSVRAKLLWPGFAPGRVDTVRVSAPGRDAADTYRRDAGGIWWLRRPADGLSRVPVAEAYQTGCADRRREEDGAVWYRARSHTLNDLLSLLGDVRVKGYSVPGAAADAMFPGGGLRIAVSGRDGMRHTVAFGGDLAGNHVAGRRDGYSGLLVLSREVVERWSPALADGVDTDLLTYPASDADSLALSAAGLGQLRLARDGDDWRFAAGNGGSVPAGIGQAAGDLVFHIDHLAIDAVLAGCGGPRAPWDADGPRYDLTLWYTGPGVPPQLTVRFGFVDGRAAAAVGEDGGLFAVPPSFLVTLRSFLLASRPQ